VTRKAASHATPPYEAIGGSGSIIPRLIVVVTCIAAIGAMIYSAQETDAAISARRQATVAATLSAAPSPGDRDEAPEGGGVPIGGAASATALPSVAVPTLDLARRAPRIGIVAGHWGNDAGAVCPDGLQEVDVNLKIALELVHILESLGYEVDLLQEFDARLQGYYAEALVSIHADSCEPFPDADPPASGFKIASAEDSYVPDEEMRLVRCLAQRYGARTGMYYHSSTVTYDMTRYHTFYEIDGRTPAAIIETGFMWADRNILVSQPDLIAHGIADGIVCFLKREDFE
jgi:N-acetylmuramoyl-L-alanine amidase